MKNLIERFVRRRNKWAIGIYEGRSSFDFKPAERIQNPVLTAQDVKDVSAEFVADPFMIYEEGTWYMFFEVLNQRDGLGDIALATSHDGFKWNYQKVILDEPFHLSYPYVFKWNHEYYMIPETHQTHSIRLYRATSFPTQWSFEKTLLDGHDYVDSSIFNFENRWWLFTSTTANKTLRLYYTDHLTDPWIEHPQSPIVANNLSIARPAGRVVLSEQGLVRYAQDCRTIYGRQVYAFIVKELTPTSYREEMVKDIILRPSGSGWNKTGMHSIDPHLIDQDYWLACVDGHYQTLLIRLGSKTHCINTNFNF
jgi:hypothetical protein